MQKLSRRRAMWCLVISLLISALIVGVSLARGTLSDGLFPALLILGIGVWTVFWSSTAKNA